jgi:Domain of unknown function (DUF4397)
MKSILAYISVAALVVATMACEKNLLDQNVQSQKVDATTSTNLKVVNVYTFNLPAPPAGVPGTRFYVYQNNAKLNGNPLSAAGAWPGPSVYAALPAGKSFISLLLDRRVGNDYGQVQRGDTTFRAEFTFAPGKYYTAFMTDQFPRQKLIFTEDDMTVPAAGKYRLRIGNFVPDPARPIDLYSRREKTKIATNVNYNEVKAMVELNVPTIADTFDVMEAGNTRSIYFATFQPVNGRIYTLYTFGRRGFATERVASYTNR